MFIIKGKAMHTMQSCESTCTASITAANDKALSEKMVISIADFFRVLGDPTRIRILDALSVSEMCVCDLSDLLNMNQSAISHQLRTLKDTRFVTFRREGKSTFYSLADDHIMQILSLGTVHLSEKET
jgi:ArsR family transcriptional regulator